jgi:hypothetical protein
MYTTKLKLLFHILEFIDSALQKTQISVVHRIHWNFNSEVTKSWEVTIIPQLGNLRNKDQSESWGFCNSMAKHSVFLGHSAAQTWGQYIVLKWWPITCCCTFTSQKNGISMINHFIFIQLYHILWKLQTQIKIHQCSFDISVYQIGSHYSEKKISF